MRGGGAEAARWRKTWGRRARGLSGISLAAVVMACPLLVGSVHPPAIIGILAATAVTLVLAVVGERLAGNELRGPFFSVFFLLLLVISLLQIIPWPTSWRARVDPAGLLLLENAPHGVPHLWPLSFDPLSTREEVGAAAATVVVFALALHNAAGRRNRKLVLNALALAGSLAVANGITHRIFGIEDLFGVFNIVGGVLPGPFINPNHSAEFFELAAFAGLSLALDAEAELRIAWLAVAGVDAAAALTTLSRGAMLALFAGGAAFVLLRLRMRRSDRDAEAGPPPPGRVRGMVTWGLVACGCLIALAFALGASPVLDELAATNLTNGTEKTIVWKDALSIVARHPLGIGRHAFDRVFPCYKTLSLNSRFQFVENGPLQLLIDVGWPGMVLLGLCLLWLFRRLPRANNEVSAALLAGLVAVLVHNLVDFGLETLGIRLSFAAVAGAAVGRAYGRIDRSKRLPRLPSAWTFAGIGIVAVGLLIGLISQFQPTAEKLERRWKQAATAQERRRLAVEGGDRYPTDFYFPLLQSYDEPLRVPGPAGKGSSSPRLAALNRAMRLCPSCSFVHEQVARSFQRLGLRDQALSGFRDTIRWAPTRLGPLLIELESKGYSPAQLATLAVGGSAQTMVGAKFLVPKRAVVEVETLLAEAEAQGAPSIDISLVRAELALALSQYARAKTLLAKVRSAAPEDGRSYELGARVAEAESDLPEALEEARAATTAAPFVVEYARHRLTLVLQLHKWSELDEALDRLKMALRQNGNNVTEVNMIAGVTHEQRGNLGRALSEFRMASTVDSESPAAWEAIARVSEQRGDLNGAVEAYERLSKLQPSNDRIPVELARLHKTQAEARLKDLLP